MTRNEAKEFIDSEMILDYLNPLEKAAILEGFDIIYDRGYEIVSRKEDVK